MLSYGSYISSNLNVVFACWRLTQTTFQRKKASVDLKIETKGYYTREEVKDNKIRRISVQRKALKGHAANLKEKLNYALKEADDAKLSQK